MALSILYGRDVETMTYADPEERMNRFHQIGGKLNDLIKVLTGKFNAEYGSMICNDIEAKLFERSFNKWNPEDREEKNRLGGYKEKCPSVVENSARWIAELILEEQGKAERP